MTEHVCFRSTCLPQKVLRTSELYGIEADLTVNENIFLGSGDPIIINKNTSRVKKYFFTLEVFFFR